MTTIVRLVAGNGDRAFGGSVLSALLHRAAADVPPGRVPHSLHAHFLQPAPVDVEVEVDTAILRASPSFTTVAVQASQDDVVVATATASFHLPHAGLEHTTTAPADAGGPHAAPPARGGPIPDVDAPARAPIDLREAPRSTGPDGRPVLRFWVRRRGSDRPATPLEQAATLAWASDLCLTRVADVEHEHSEGVRRAASLDHAMWFHREHSVGAWLLYEVTSPTYSCGLALSSGRFFDREGRLIASVVQESMLRRRPS